MTRVLQFTLRIVILTGAVTVAHFPRSSMALSANTAESARTASAADSDRAVRAAVNFITKKHRKTITAHPEAKNLARLGYRIIGENRSKGTLLMARGIRPGLASWSPFQGLYQSEGEIEIAITRYADPHSAQTIAQVLSKMDGHLNNETLIQASSVASLTKSKSFDDLVRTLQGHSPILMGSVPYRIGTNQYLIVDAFRLKASSLPSSQVGSVIEQSRFLLE